MKTRSKLEYVVELECEVWIAQGTGDPPRTLARKYAKKFTSPRLCRIALSHARGYRPFVDAKIYFYYDDNRDLMCHDYYDTETYASGDAHQRPPHISENRSN